MLGRTFLFCALFSLNAEACLPEAYPSHIHSVSDYAVAWKDGTHMPLINDRTTTSAQSKLDAPTLADQLNDGFYLAGKPEHPYLFTPSEDAGRIRYEPFFRKMYGNSQEEVEKNLATIYWMPGVFGRMYPLQVTTVNGIDEKLKRISEELEQLGPAYYSFLANPGGAYQTRLIANTRRTSPHSFGIAIDINTTQANYWLWDAKKKKGPLSYSNQIPWEIVLIFEKHGFIWGGKWKHYDTMHFEYRPELLPH